MTRTELTALVREAQGGDAGAFGEVVRRTQDALIMAARALAGDVHEAEDAVQEAYLAAHARLGDLRDPARFRAWIARILTRIALSRRRRPAVGRLGNGDARVPARPATGHARLDALVAEVERLPVDRGLREGNVARPRLTVRLVRGDKDEETRIECQGADLGGGGKAWAELTVRVGQARAKLPAAPTLDASRTVPYEEVVKAIDLLRAAGYEEIRFVGTPPPRAAEPSTARTKGMLHGMLRRDGDRTVIEFPAGEVSDLERGLPRLVGRIRALKDAGLARPVTLEVRPGVPEAERRQVVDAIEKAGAQVELLVE